MHLENFPPTTGFEPGTSRTPGEDSNPLPQSPCDSVAQLVTESVCQPEGCEFESHVVWKFYNSK